MMSVFFYMSSWVLLGFLSNMTVWLNLYFYIFFLFLTFSLCSLGLSISFLGWELGLDTLSFSLIVLTIWLLVVMMTSSFSVLASSSSFYFLLMLNLLLLFLVFSFMMLNFLGFYFFFEASLIPTLLIILGWGYQPERLQAGVYFIFYTMFSSLPLLVILMVIYGQHGSLLNYMDFELSLNFFSSFYLKVLVFLSLISAFLVKMPMFFVHLWLPKAHVEAPVSGSMILAGVLLKLGGYGLCRVLGMMPLLLNKTSGLVVSLGIGSLLFVSMMCCRLNDMKALVAYSSVAHMGMVIMGLFIGSTWGYNGALMMMLGHGLSSSGLFCALNMYYERTGSRSFYVNSGFILLLPIFSLLFFMLCVSNIAAPPTMNLLAEVFLMGSVVGYDLFMLILFPLGSFFGAVFSIFLFSYSQHGKILGSISSYVSVKLIELKSLILHIIPLNIMVLKFELFMLWL